MSDYLRRIVARMAPRPAPTSLQPITRRRWGGADADSFAVEPPVGAPPALEAAPQLVAADHDVSRPAGLLHAPTARRSTVDFDRQLPASIRSIRQSPRIGDSAVGERDDIVHIVDSRAETSSIDRFRSLRRDASATSHGASIDLVDPAADRSSSNRSPRDDTPDDDRHPLTRPTVRTDAPADPQTLRPVRTTATTWLEPDRPTSPSATDGPPRAAPTAPAVSPSPADPASARGARPMIVAPTTRASPAQPVPARIVIGRISVVVDNPAPLSPPRPSTGRLRPRRDIRSTNTHVGSSSSGSRFTHRFGIGQL